MTDCDCVTFLQEMLPRLGLRWRGFRKVRRQVCKRLQALDLPDLSAYRTYLDTRTPAGPFDLILCRNLVFTYFDEAGQQQVLARLIERLQPGGILAIGKREQLPVDHPALTPWDTQLRLYRRR